MVRHVCRQEATHPLASNVVSRLAVGNYEVTAALLTLRIPAEGFANALDCGLLSGRPPVAIKGLAVAALIRELLTSDSSSGGGDRHQDDCHWSVRLALQVV